MDTNIEVATFEAAYGRRGSIWIARADWPACAKCGTTERYRLCMDSSGGEYGPGALCWACIEQAFMGQAPTAADFAEAVFQRRPPGTRIDWGDPPA